MRSFGRGFYRTPSKKSKMDPIIPASPSWKSSKMDQEGNLMELVATLRVFAAQTIKRRPKNTRPSNLFLRRTFAIENNYKRIKIVFPKKTLVFWV